jgi:protein TonB
MNGKLFSFLASAARRVLSTAGAVLLTGAFFLVLPLIQAMTQEASTDLTPQVVDTANLPPPPPPQEDEPEPEKEEEPEPPELTETAPPLDLAQLELALNPGFGDGWTVGDFAVDLKSLAGDGEDVDELFSLSDLDQKPRVVHQPSPVQNAHTRKRAPGTVNVMFIVDQRGRVESPVVQSSSDPEWKFEPGTLNGEPARFRMRVPITVPES